MDAEATDGAHMSATRDKFGRPIVVVTLPSLAIYDQIAATVGEAA